MPLLLYDKRISLYYSKVGALCGIMCISVYFYLISWGIMYGIMLALWWHYVGSTPPWIGCITIIIGAALCWHYVGIEIISGDIPPPTYGGSKACLHITSTKHEIHRNCQYFCLFNIYISKIPSTSPIIEGPRPTPHPHPHPYLPRPNVIDKAVLPTM